MQDFKGHQKNQGNITTLKDHNNFLVTELKEREIPSSSNKRIQKNCFKEAQSHTRKQFREIRKQYMNKVRSLTKKSKIL